MTNQVPWTKTFEGHGIYNYELTEWAHFHELLHKAIPDPKSFIWRGQRSSDWPLASTLQRALQHLPQNQKAAAAERHLAEFQYAARGRRGPSPSPLTENEWWALGQHYGLATPLLDWTTSPFAAAFFAFSEPHKPQSPSRAIYALSLSAPNLGERLLAKILLSKHALGLKWFWDPTEPDFGVKELKVGMEAIINEIVVEREKSLRQVAQTNQEVSIIRPMSNENPRLVNQAGLFTKVPLRNPMCMWLRETFPASTKRELLIRIKIPDSARQLCLRDLNRMNINHLTLFPDLEGASKFANTHLEISQY